MVFLDESGLMLQPLVRRTWAPVGRTPILCCWQRHDRLSLISAFTISPVRQHLGVYWIAHRGNVQHGEVMSFLRRIRCALGRDLIVVLDRLSAHKAAAARLSTHSPGAFAFEWLPAYAPELNPVEYLWKHTKYDDLANFVPLGIDDLEEHANASLATTRTEPLILRGCLDLARLPL